MGGTSRSPFASARPETEAGPEHPQGREIVRADVPSRWISRAWNRMRTASTSIGSMDVRGGEIWRTSLARLHHCTISTSGKAAEESQTGRGCWAGTRSEEHTSELQSLAY